MTPRTRSLLNATSLCGCTLALTGWSGALPAGVGSVALASLGLVGLALFPHIAPSDEARAADASEDAGTRATSS